MGEKELRDSITRVCRKNAEAIRVQPQMTEKQWNAINGADRLASVRRLMADLKDLWDKLPEATRTQLRPIIRKGHIAIVKEDK